MPEANMLAIITDALVFKGIGGLGFFLLGLKFMSEGMQAVAGNRLRKLISVVTTNRLIACGVGTLVTSIIQSSSVTTVMVVGFVNGGFMTLMQAIGVILGANIGTTVTGWILTLKIGKFGLPILGFAAIVYLFSRRERTRYTAMAILGVGMVFFGLETMAAGFKNEQVRIILIDFFSRMHADTYVGVLKCSAVSCLATMVVQSSSATFGVALALVKSDVIGFETAAGLVLGLNIGTTVTAFLASLGSSTNAKRAAYAHIIFNVVGTLWLLPVFFQYTAIIDGFGKALGIGLLGRIAMVHSGFNILNAIVFLPLMPLLAQIVTRMVPQVKRKETPHLTFLNVRMLDTPAIGIQQSQDEINRMGDHTRKMLGMLDELSFSPEPDEAKTKKLFHREEILDVVQKEVTEFLGHLLSGNVPMDVVAAGRQQLRMADEYESISDYIVDIMRLYMKIRDMELLVSTEGADEIGDLHSKIAAYVNSVSDAVREGDREILKRAHTDGEVIDHVVSDCRQRHLRRVEAQKVSPLKSIFFVDILQSYLKIKNHALNIAEALAGQK